MEALLQIIKTIYGYLWGLPMLVILLGTHLYFTIRLGFIQKKIPLGVRLSFSRKETGENGISPFSALATALAATIGTGNIIGISAAIAIGGPGAVFWCWMTGVLGIATCYAECFLSAKYRVSRPDGSFTGGPMYVMEKVLHQKSAAVVFAISTILASLGMGSSVQSHSISAAVQIQYPVSSSVIGIIAAVLVGIVMLGGARQISKVCTYLVPFMSLFYFGGCLLLIWMNKAYLGEALAVIVKSAFQSKSVAGGIAGTAVMVGMRTGISKGLFTNEAGLGSIPMTAAASRTKSPVKQGVISMTGPFWDTVVMCAITGIAIVSSMIRQPELYVQAADDQLCFLAFARLPVNGSLMLSISLVLFAYASIIGWSYYGECAVQYLWGQKKILVYRIAYVMAVYLGAVMSLDLVWTVSDLFNSFMALPNILCVWMLRKVVIRETRAKIGEHF
jgi:AGCS family alanine or glycine:cation symporter